MNPLVVLVSVIFVGSVVFALITKDDPMIANARTPLHNKLGRVFDFAVVDILATVVVATLLGLVVAWFTDNFTLKEAAKVVLMSNVILFVAGEISHRILGV